PRCRLCTRFVDDAVEVRSFFYLVARRLQDLNFHGLATQGALQFLDPGLGFSQRAHRHDLAIRAHRRFGALRGQVLPSLNQRAGDPQLATQLRGCELASQHSIDLLSLEFGREQTPAIRTAGWFHCTLRSLESVSFEGVSLNWGSKHPPPSDGI